MADSIHLPMSGRIEIKTLGLGGVNVDKDPLELRDDQMRKAQNAIHDPLGVNAGLRKRPGLTPFNLTNLGGNIRGSIAAPVTNYTASGSPNIYLGRGPTS